MVGREGLASGPSVVAVVGVVTAVAMVRDSAVEDLAAASVEAVEAARAVEARGGVVEVEQDAALRGWAVGLGQVVVEAVGSGLEAGKEAAVAEVAEVAMAAAVAEGEVEGAVEARATVVEARRTSGSCYQPDSARH